MPFYFKTGKPDRLVDLYRVIALVIFSLVLPGGVNAAIRSGDSLFNKTDSSAKKKAHFRITQRGILTGYGYGINKLNLPEGVYSPLFLMGQIGIELGHNTGSSQLSGPISLIIEPQFNLVLLRTGSHIDKKYEAGLGIGLQEVFNLTPRFKPFIGLAVGPHFISVHTSLQHTGFIFSDNAIAGFYYFFTKKIALQAQFRARHMSNANLVLPNHGINTSNFLAGLNWFL